MRNCSTTNHCICVLLKYKIQQGINIKCQNSGLWIFQHDKDRVWPIQIQTRHWGVTSNSITWPSHTNFLPSYLKVCQLKQVISWLTKFNNGIKIRKGKLIITRHGIRTLMWTVLQVSITLVFFEPSQYHQIKVICFLVLLIAQAWHIHLCNKNSNALTLSSWAINEVKFIYLTNYSEGWAVSTHHMELIRSDGDQQSHTPPNDNY